MGSREAAHLSVPTMTV